MTELTSEELRAACEMAGLGLTSEWGGRWAVYAPVGESGAQVRMLHNHPALPAYVAELLVGKVRDQGWMLLAENDTVLLWNCWDRNKSETLRYDHDAAEGMPLSSALIRAAMAVLA